eukprot:CAMPEP_0202707946 /NCGR_PEP_ID=MMETSP1385-20130828/20219_1 /ASSEMBLY_ACC=CAM_ASM_000861 /TAXON_ID=933848 /ORGANISM="Elphidium margaritaceum" /LENGTH=334 /DNA_ID=CAMNT_0049366787 /DNA_START=9 /DNA_END=1013 /DNA_ORIENTATION=+
MKSSVEGEAIRIYKTGDVDVLQSERVTYNAADSDILIRNEYAGLNFIDTYHRSGLYPFPSYPVTLGVDGCGVVEAISPALSAQYQLNIGDRVAYYDQGSYAQYKLLPAQKAIPITDADIDARVVVASVVQGMTAHYLSRSTFELTKDSTLVIHAGAGGVGQFLIQIAKNVVGVKTIIATASNAEKQAIAKKLGADYAVSYNELEDAVSSVTDGKGVDVVYDGVGKNTYASSMKVLRKRGLCVFYGNASGPVPAISPLELSKLGSIYITRCVLAHYTLTREELLARSNDLMQWIKTGQIQVSIDKEMKLTLENVVDAHRYIEAGKTTGKVVFDCK